jgi:hypothetical protein
LTVASFTALYDACVLYPAPLRDLLMHLALTDLFRAKWTDAIHDEWIRGVLERRPDLTRESSTCWTSLRAACALRSSVSAKVSATRQSPRRNCS